MNSNEGSVTPAGDHTIEACNSLLRGELAAVENYGQAIDKHAGSRVTGELQRIRQGHSRSVTLLAGKVREIGGEPNGSPENMGQFARELQSAAALFGGNSTIEALHRREEANRTDYQLTLLDDEVATDLKLMIREDLLPPVIAHLTALDRLEHAV